MKRTVAGSVALAVLLLAVFGVLRWGGAPAEHTPDDGISSMRAASVHATVGPDAVLEDEGAQRGQRLDPPERASIAAPATPDDRWSVLVLDGDGRPVPGVDVVALERLDRRGLGRLGPWTPRAPGAPTPAVLASGVTGADGRLTLEGTVTAGGGLLALPDDRPWEWSAAPSPSADVTLVLRRTGRVRGEVLIDGAAPPDPLELSVSGFEDRGSTWREAARAYAAERERRTDRRRAETDGFGAFEISGVPLESPVELRVDGPFRRAEGGAPRWSVPVDGKPLRLQIVRAPMVDVELRGGRGSEALGGIELAAAFADSTRSVWSQRLPTAIGERVQLPLPVQGFRTLEITARDSTGRRLARREVGRTEVTPGRVVVLTVPADRVPLVLTVVGPSGDLLPDAHLRYDGRDLEAVGGELQLEWWDGAGTAVVAAPCHVPRVIDGPALLALATSGGTVVLNAAPTIEVVLEAPWEPDAIGVGVDVLDGWTTGPAIGGLPGAPPREFGDDLTWRACGPAADGTVTLALRDAWGSVLRSADVALDEGAHHRVRWAVEAWPVDLVGRVVDESGRPVSSATLTLGRRLLGGVPVESDGTFALRGVFGGRAQVTCSAPGHLTRTLSVPELEFASDLVLERARSLRVRIADDAGGRSVGALWFERGSERFLAAEVASGDYRFDAIPLRPGQLRSADGSIHLPVDDQQTQLEHTIDRRR